jgi:outer membrane protein assembly factor BamD (BamD/ComL family)
MRKLDHRCSRRQATPAILWRLSGLALLTSLIFFSGCAARSDEANNNRPASPFEQANALFSQGNYETAFKENQRVLAEGKGAPDRALFNMGMIAAYSSNPKKDYPKALVSFRTLVKEHPQSSLAEQAKVWIQVLEEHQKVAEERQKLAEEKRALTREKELLSQEREKLKYAAEKSRQVDIEIEKRRRQTLGK